MKKLILLLLTMLCLCSSFTVYAEGEPSADEIVQKCKEVLQQQNAIALDSNLTLEEVTASIYSIYSRFKAGHKVYLHT